MFGSGDFGGKSLSWFWKVWNFNFKSFENALKQFLPDHPPKHVITSTYFLLGKLVYTYY